MEGRASRSSVSSVMSSCICATHHQLTCKTRGDMGLLAPEAVSIAFARKPGNRRDSSRSCEALVIPLSSMVAMFAAFQVL